MTVTDRWSFNQEAPPHIPRGELVGPLVRFRGQQVAVTSSPPRDTLDPRYNQCTDHHLACDCQEADSNEQLAECRSDMQSIRDAMRSVLDGHAIEVWDGPRRRPDLECRCSGCRIARAIPWAGRPYDGVIDLRSGRW